MAISEDQTTAVIGLVSEHYGVSKGALLGRSRTKLLARARQVTMYLLRLVTRASYVEVGVALGREHSTVIHGISVITAEISLRAEFRADIEAMQEALLAREPKQRGRVRIREAIYARLQAQVDKGIYGSSVEDYVDRILCEHFQKLEAR